MKKIPTLFERVYENHRVVEILPNVTPGMEFVLEGQGVATVKWDGACCAVIGGKFYKRYDANVHRGRKVPDGAIKCQYEPDPVTGHLPCWVKCDRENPADKWFWQAYDRMLCFVANGIEKYIFSIPDWTYEAIGAHFQGNPYEYDLDMIVPHGKNIIMVERTFDGIKSFLSENYIEGIVFWLDGEPKCKIKRSDFGFAWK